MMESVCVEEVERLVSWSGVDRSGMRGGGAIATG